MPIFAHPSRTDVYKRLKKGYKRLSTTAQLHLQDSLLHELGIDHIQVDLHQETRRGGPYFVPMSKEELALFTERPPIEISIDPEYGDFTASDDVRYTYVEQLESSGLQRRTPIDSRPSKWIGIPPRHGTYAQHLYGYPAPLLPIWRYQLNWVLEDCSVTKGLPHRSCVSRAAVSNVRGLLRVEVQILICMMIESMREEGHEDVMVVPVVLVSIIGHHARIIQAHISVGEQRFKVRYSQLYDFNNCSKDVMDLFLRWSLSTPLSEPQPQFRRSGESPSGFEKGVSESTKGSVSGNNNPEAAVAHISIDAL